MRIPCRVVLVRPKVAANIGATTRIMRNMGLEDLVLVEPVADKLDPRSLLLATHSEDLLHATRTVDQLGEAVADCGIVIGTSARTGGLFRKQTVGTPEEILSKVVTSTCGQLMALVFGPEDNGLRNEEVARCHYLVHIPTDNTHTSLNLAQAVTVCLYELRRCWLAVAEQIRSEPQHASVAYQEKMLERLQTSLEAIRFLHGPKADSLMYAIRHLLARAKPSEMEVDLLFGLARQIQWYVDHHSERKEF